MSRRVEPRVRIAFGLLLFSAACSTWAQSEPIDGVTFVHRPGTLFAPVREVGEALGFTVHFDAKTEATYFDDTKIASAVEMLGDGSRLMPIREVSTLGVEFTWDKLTATATATRGERTVKVKWGAKRIEIDKSKQRLKAFQGGRLVLETKVSTGRIGYATPNGTFEAGPYKARMHRSSLYNQAPMPWSIQVTGNIFLHGYESVPGRPASHGCIRLPLWGVNPAKWLFNWTDLGTPVKIKGEWRRK